MKGDPMLDDLEGSLLAGTKFGKGFQAVNAARFQDFAAIKGLYGSLQDREFWLSSLAWHPLHYYLKWQIQSARRAKVADESGLLSMRQVSREHGGVSTTVGDRCLERSGELSEDRALWHVLASQAHSWLDLPMSLNESVSAETRDRFDDAADLLCDLLPQLGPDTLSYMTRYGVLSGELRVARSDLEMPGLIFVSDHMVAELAELTRAIFHETLHTKKSFIDMADSRSSDSDPDAPDAANIYIPWRHGEGPWWDLSRALDAYHVYVHLCLFESRLQNAIATHLQGLVLRRTLFRANYLRVALGKHRDALRANDQALLSWLEPQTLPPLSLNEVGTRWLAFGADGAQGQIDVVMAGYATKASD